MEYWHTYPSESELTFAQTTHLNVAAHSDWACGLKDVLVQTEANQKKHLSSMTAPKLPSERMSDKVMVEMLPSSSKKIKTEDTLSERSQVYGGWLQGLREIANDLPSANNTIKSIVNKNARFSELLKSVMAELERKLAVDEFKTQGSECGFWASVQVMAKTYGIDFSDFEKLCFSPEFKGLMCPLDGGIPGLVDQGHDGPWSFGQNSYQLTHPREDNSISGLLSYLLPDYEGVAPLEVFPQFPLDTARDDMYSTASPTAFAQSPFLDYQSSILGVNSPEQGHFYTPGSPYTAFTHKSKRDGPLILNSSTTIPTTSETPLKKERNNCLSVCLNTKKIHKLFPTTVPEACKRKIQRQRRRAMSYNHLTTNFGALKCSLTWNSGNIRDSDLQFLLEKELKPSDVGTLGRIILPKRQAEEKLPALEAKEGRVLEFEDLQTSQIWSLRFRFWPNNKTRMYVLECTGNFVRLHNLEKGDYVVLYRNPATGKYMITGKKTATVPKGLGVNEQLSLPSSSKVGGGKASFDIASTKPSPKPKPKPKPTVPAKESSTPKPSPTSAPMLTPTVPAKESTPHVVDERSRTTLKSTHLVVSGSCFMGDMEDADDLIKGFSSFEPDGRSIDEIFDFKQSIV